MRDDEANFPIDVKSPLINFLQKMIIWSVKVLALLMAIVILWSVIEVVFVMLIKAKEPYLLVMNMDEILTIFGAFLVVLIAIEIFINIILYLKKDMSHLKLVIATALMAIARKVIILDYDQVHDWHMVGMGVLILSLGFAYWFISRTPSTSISQETSSSIDEAITKS
jgi:uncharacterized membrane protein (DUF373 family)